MSAFYDCSSAAQYAALGGSNPPPGHRRPIQISGLEAMGRYVGASHTPPEPAPAEIITVTSVPVREQDYA
jgi:hypothetical protein